MSTLTKTIGKSHIKMRIEKDRVYICDLLVHPSQRGQKLGHKLIDIAINLAKIHNFDKVELYANPTDGTITESALINYYLNYGFIHPSGLIKNRLFYFI